MTDRYFRHYAFKNDEDVLYIGLDEWITLPDNPAPLFGAYVCTEAEVNERFDRLEKDLRRARRSALSAVRKLSGRARG
jgi:hypothetical protein